jgi:predicted O-methyltransferase YrrM
MKKWFEPSQPDEVRAMPWLHSAVIEYLEQLIQPGWRILEHGSGGSTLWLSKFDVQVTAIESDPNWYAEILRRKSGAKLILWDRRDRLPSLEPTYDLLLIDGEPVEGRSLYVKAARRLVKPGGWIVLDNCNRPEYIEAREELQKKSSYFVTFMMKPGKYLNTEFYQLGGL